MTPPNMAAITASLERSLQSFSLNHHCTTAGEESINSSDATLELNSNMTLPYSWEQCLDLKTGEMYYINWRTGMKSKDDPRETGFNTYFYSDYDDEGDDEGEEEDDESSYTDSETSSVESSPAASSSGKPKRKDEENEDENEGENEGESSKVGGHVLVVAGCKGCFMYFMVAKQVEDCPKCCGQLLHFDRSDDN